MKSIKKLTLTGIGAFALIMANLSAKEGVKADGSYELPSFNVGEIVTLPAPMQIKEPVVKASMRGASFDMRLTIDENGNASNVDTVRPLFSLGLSNEEERDLAVQMIQLLSTWKFTPALDANGEAVAIKAIMPVKVIERDSEPLVTVSVKQDKSASVIGG